MLNLCRVAKPLGPSMALQPSSVAYVAPGKGGAIKDAEVGQELAAN